MINHFSVSLIFTLLCALGLPSQAPCATETSSFEDILKVVDDKTLVVVDIEDTLIVSSCTLGSTPWWNHFIEVMLSGNVPLHRKHEEANAMVEKVLMQVPVEPIEATTPDIIRKLQQANIPVVGLTARKLSAPYSKDAGALTRTQLMSAGFDLTQPAFPLTLDLNNPALKETYCDGVIFTGKQPKGPALTQFLQTLNWKPERIVFVDDQKDNIESVETCASSMGISCFAFRYSYLDFQYEVFNPLLGNIEMANLIEQDILVTESEAEAIAAHLMSLNEDYDADFYLQYLIIRFIGS